jgi:hypothetical protein
MWATVANGSNCHLPNDTHGSTSRAGVNLIEFTDYLRSKGLFPMIKTVEPIQYSAFDLARYVDTELLSHTAASDPERSSSSRPTAPHFDCHVGFRLGPVMRNILDNAIWPVNISMVEHIRSNTCECQFDSAYGGDPHADLDGIPVEPRQFV